MAPSSSGEIYELPEHAGDDGLSDWRTPASSIAAPARVRSHDVASEIDRLLNAAREALEQAEASVAEESAGESSSAVFAWPTWNAAKSNIGPAIPSGDCESTVRVVVGKLTLSSDQHTAFRGGVPLRLSPAATTDVNPTLVEVRVDGRTQARGLLVVHEGRFAVRITEVVAPDAASSSPTTANPQASSSDANNRNPSPSPHPEDRQTQEARS